MAAEPGRQVVQNGRADFGDDGGAIQLLLGRQTAGVHVFLPLADAPVAAGALWGVGPPPPGVDGLAGDAQFVGER